MSAYYDEFENKYYNPDDDAKKPGQNENWKMIQKGFSKISSTQLETSEGLTLGKGTDDEESLTASELEEIKNPSQLETSGGLTLGKGTADEESLTASELEELKNPSQLETSGGLTLGKGTADEESLTASELHDLKNASSNPITSFIYANGTLGALSIAGHGHVYKEVNVLNPAIELLRSLISNDNRPMFTVHSNGTSPEAISLQFDASIDNNYLQSTGSQAPTKMYIRITNPTDSQVTFTGNWGTFNVVCTMFKYSYN